MLLPIVASLLLLPTAPADTSASSARPVPVRVWLPDTMLRVGDLGRVYVQMREAGHLAVLHVEPSGRIRVLFPARPTDDDMVPAGGTFVVSGVGDSATFRVVAPGVGTVVAVRSWTPLHYDALRAGTRWDYTHALLLQPTAGVPLAALLDIADRLADGEAYVYDVAEYRTPGAVAARHQPPDSVCFSCLAARHTGMRPGTAGSAASAAPAIDQSYAYLPGTYVVDCSDATVDNALCGVQDNRSYTTVEQTEITQPEGYVYPVSLPLFIGNRRRARLRRGVPPPTPAIALNLRRVPGRIVPPPRRRVAPIVIEQPHAPSHPWMRATPQAPTAPAPAAAPQSAPPRRIVLINAPRAPTVATPIRFDLTGRLPSLAASVTARPPTPRPVVTARAAYGQAPRPVIVPRR
jgi:Domain of unknown function (DUF4384)